MVKSYLLKEQPAVSAKLRIDYAKELNPEQLDVVLHADGPCLVLAGAGSGKTRTLVYRVAYLLERGISAKHILLMTFTNKAAREMLNRVEVLLRAKPQGLTGGTFHHVGNLILRKYAPKLGYTNAYSILDEDDAKAMVKSITAGFPGVPKEEFFPKADVLESLFSFSANSQRPVAELARQWFRHLRPEIVPTIEGIQEAYVKRKKEANVMDFDDLLVRWLELLEKHEDVRRVLSTQFRYLLVDEYQDTNTIQAQIIRLLASQHGNVLVVGDDAQSIYSFRAADIRNILRFPKDFPDARTFKIETNYRSTPEILQLANSAIVHNAQQFRKRLKSVRKSGAKPALVRLLDSDQQASFVCQRVLELQEGGHALKDMAVLFRATSQIIELELELGKRSIPYRVRGGLRFFEQAHIKDVIAHFRVLHNPRDELAWKRILELQPGLGPSAAEKIWQAVRGAGSLPEALRGMPKELPQKAAHGFGKVAATLKTLSAVRDRFIASGIETIVTAGYRQYVEAAFDNATERLEDLEQLAAFALQYTDLEKFLSDVTLSEGFRGERVQGTEDDDDELVLSTVHQAKGLEWKAVFVISLAQGSFPHIAAFNDPEEMEEERRLFYVAVTRAQDELYLAYPIISSSFRTGRSINHPSVFLAELPPETYEEWEIEGEGERTIQIDDLDSGKGSGGEGILDKYLR